MIGRRTATPLGFVCEDLVEVSPSIQRANDLGNVVNYAIADDMRTSCN